MAGSRRNLALLGVLLVAVATATSGCGTPSPWRSQLVSADATGTNGGNGPSQWPRWSPDGDNIAFLSLATDLGPTDTNGPGFLGYDLYIRDLTTGTTTLASVNATGTDSGNGPASWPVFSGDGTSIAFVSGADNLGPTDTNGTSDLYVRDLVTGTTSMVSVNAAGTDSGGGVFQPVAFSPDSTKIAFHTVANGYGPTDTNGFTDDIYLRDLAAGTTSLVSVNALGTNSGNGHSYMPVFSPDGSKIAFLSTATDLDPAAPGQWGIYERDLVAGTTSLIVPGATSIPVYGPNGTTLAFTTEASLVPSDTNTRLDVYVKDLTSGSITFISGADPAANWSDRPVLSPDGAAVLYESYPHASGEEQDLYLYDVSSGSTSLVATRAENAQFDQDGANVLFSSLAIDSNTRVYLRDLAAGTTTTVSVDANGADPGQSENFAASFAPDGGRIVYMSTASTLGPNDTNGSHDIYLATTPP